VPKPKSNGLTEAELADFQKDLKPMETQIPILTDERTNARYCECHVKADTLIALSTINVPLNPSDPTAPRANREITDNVAFRIMKADALKGRSFSNIVCEYTKSFGMPKPLKIIGGQHRIEAIREALEQGQDKYHGIKVYFGLNIEQRLDVQLISNTNIGTSRDLIDRMLEDARGPELRTWCRSVGLLKPNENFSDARKRGGSISVRLARTFIMNFYQGQTINEKLFETVDTTPVLSKTGRDDPTWIGLIAGQPELWKDQALRHAAQQFVALITAQRAFFVGHQPKGADWPDKTFNPAILSGWAYVSGLLQTNQTRLQRHYDLAKTHSHDPLNGAELAEGRHVSDKPTYRGLGNRQDPKECGRAVELFYKQSEKGHGITDKIIDIAISRHVLKQNHLEVKAKEERENL
jgi:hypothetical protein